MTQEKRIKFQVPHGESEAPNPLREGVLVPKEYPDDWLDVEVKIDWKTKKVFSVRKDWIQET